MNLAEKILKFTTVALGLKNKTLRIQGEEFRIAMCAVTNDNGPKDDLPALTIQLFFPDDVPAAKEDCTCEGCKVSQAMSPKISVKVAQLLTEGRTRNLILDSCGHATDGFTAKVRHTATRRCDVGEGKTLILAVAHATAKAIRE
jgi:hypothetical protein